MILRSLRPRRRLALALALFIGTALLAVPPGRGAGNHRICLPSASEAEAPIDEKPAPAAEENDNFFHPVRPRLARAYRAPIRILAGLSARPELAASVASDWIRPVRRQSVPRWSNGLLAPLRC